MLNFKCNCGFFFIDESGLRMIAKDIDQIAEEDLQRLIDNSVLERKTIEYKQF